MSPSFQVIIPARYASTRLPGKPLLMIGEETLIQNVYECAARSAASRVIIATDDERIDDAGRSFGATVVMTAQNHPSGTDRVNEAVARLGIPDNEIIVNLQGDEYGFDPVLINQVAMALHANPDRQMATLCEAVTDRETFENPNTVKVVVDGNHSALYFSRAPIPWFRVGDKTDNHDFSHGAYKHIGIYAYTAGFLQQFSSLPPCRLERDESLEQLRALYYGHTIHVEEADGECGIEINTNNDLILARKLIGK